MGEGSTDLTICQKWHIVEKWRKKTKGGPNRSSRTRERGHLVANKPNY